MGLTAHTKHALRISLGHQAGGEVIRAIEGFADALAALTTPEVSPASETSAPGMEIISTPPGTLPAGAGTEGEDFDAPEEEPKLPVGLDPAAPKPGVEKTNVTGTAKPEPAVAVGKKDPETGVASGPMVPVVGPPDDKHTPKTPAPHS